MLPTMQGLVDDAMYVYQGGITMSTEGMLVISGSMPGAWAYLTVWSTSKILSLIAVKLLWKTMNPKDGGSSSWRVQSIEFTRWIWEAYAARLSFLKACVRWNQMTNVERTPNL